MSNKALYTLLFILLITITSCQTEKQPDAQQIVDQAIEAHGGDRFLKSAISFKFRDRQYRALRDGGVFVYSRTFTDSTGQQVRDVWQNSGFTRTVNDVEVDLPEEKQKAVISCLADDPRPSYQDDPKRIYSMRFAEFDIHFQVNHTNLNVIKIDKLSE